MNLFDLIKSKRFDEVNKDIVLGNAKFPNDTLRVTDQNSFRLFKISKPTTSYKEVVDLINNNGFILANIHELLFWKGWDRKTTVVAPGSVVNLDGKDYVPCMSLDYFSEPGRYYSMCRLCLLDKDREWKGEIFFLGFKK